MPTYLGKPVSDEYLQALIDAYRDGQRAGGHEVEDGDQEVINRLSANEVTSVKSPSAFALGEAGE